MRGVHDPGHLLYGETAMFKNKGYRGIVTLCFFSVGIVAGCYQFNGLAVFMGLCICGSDISEAINGIGIRVGKMCLVLMLLSTMGCAQQAVEPEPMPSYTVEQRMSPAMHEVVMQLVWMKSDPNVFEVREPDPFDFRESGVQ